MTGSTQIVRDAVKKYENAKIDKKVSAAEQEIVQLKSDILVLEKQIGKQIDPKEYTCKWVDRGYINCEISLFFLPNHEWVMIQHKSMSNKEISYDQETTQESFGVFKTHKGEMNCERKSMSKSGALSVPLFNDGTFSIKQATDKKSCFLTMGENQEKELKLVA